MEDPVFREIPVCLHALPAHTDKPNAIRTTKFTALNWLPKSILVQFRRVANVYFLFISILM
ncbi:hypothetical protein B484DRAFT_389862, partial [Ochromonadaceae sp. CCMP2298]